MIASEPAVVRPPPIASTVASIYSAPGQNSHAAPATVSSTYAIA